MKHKHYDLIVAKAANMDLVTLCCIPAYHEWREHLLQHDMDFDESVEYFLCLPQHTGACLHWLNGGEGECTSVLGCFDINETSRDWNSCAWYTDSNLSSKIKPHKESRYIAIRRHDLYVESIAYKTEDEAIADNNPKFWNVYEIEVEVENGQSK